MSTPTPDPDEMYPYATINQAKAAGASGTDTEIAAALDWSAYVIDKYTRNVWSPRTMEVLVSCYNNVGRIPIYCTSATTGTLDSDGHTWHPDDWWGAGDYLVSVEAGTETVPPAVTRASSRLAAQSSPTAFTAQADAEGNPIGRPPAAAMSGETDPAPPQERSGQAGDRTTGDPVVDAWLEPYKMNRVLIT